MLAVVSPVLHKKSPLPSTVNVIFSPKHIVKSSPKSTVGGSSTRTITSSETEQSPDEEVTV